MPQGNYPVLTFANLAGEHVSVVKNYAVAHRGKRIALDLYMNDLAGTRCYPEIDNTKLSVGILARQVRIDDDNVTVFVFRYVNCRFQKIRKQINVARIAKQKLESGYMTSSVSGTGGVPRDGVTCNIINNVRAF